MKSNRQFPRNKLATATIALLVLMVSVSSAVAQSPDVPKQTPEVDQLKQRLQQLEQICREGVMIGGFALIAFPAQYRVTGVQTFMVSHDGVVLSKGSWPEHSRACRTD